MKKTTVSVQFDQEKTKALQFYTGKKGSVLDKELEEYLQRLYEKTVPAQTREYIESMAEPEEAPRPRPASRPGQPGE